MTKQNEYDANQALGRMDVDSKINCQHDSEPPLQIPWQVVAALLIMCIGLIGYAVAIFKV